MEADKKLTISLSPKIGNVTSTASTISKQNKVNSSMKSQQMSASSKNLITSDGFININKCPVPISQTVKMQQQEVNTLMSTSSSGISFMASGNVDNNNKKRDHSGSNKNNSNNIHINLSANNNESNKNNHKPVAIAPKATHIGLNGNNNKKDTSSVLSTKLAKIRHLPPPFNDCNDSDTQKKRCADRCDSSESSDR